MKQLALYFIILLIGYSSYCYATVVNTKIDSLLNQVENAEEKDQIIIYNELAKIFAETNPQKAINYYKESLVIAQELNDTQSEYKILIAIAKNYRVLGEPLKAIDYLEKAMVYSNNDNDNLTDIYNELGINYADAGKFDKSLEYFKLYLGIQEDLLNKENMAIAYNNISNLYRIKGEFDKSLEFCDKAVQIEKEMNDYYSLSVTYSNIALLYVDKEEYEKAWNYYYKAESLADSINDPLRKMHIYSNIADLALIEGKTSQSRSYLDQILEIAKDERVIPIIRDTYKQYAALYEKSGDFKNAFDYYQKYVNLKDSIVNDDNQNNIALLKVIYETEKKDKENEILRKDNAIHTLKNEKQQRLIYFFILLIGLIIILIIVVLDKFRTNRKNARMLADKNKRIETINIELKQVNNELEERVSKRTEELQQEINDRIKTEVALKKALEKAEEANVMKDTFLSNISHEIRTPLNAIIGLSSLLSEKFDKESDEEFKKYISGIVHSSNRLLVLLNNIIDFSLIESNEINLEKESCDIQNCIDSAAQLHSFRANEKGLKLVYDIQNHIPLISADCNNLIKVFSDIIDNAVKFTEEGEIVISAEHYEEDNTVLVQIKDTGIGINQEFLPNIFDSFSQESEGYTKNYQGAGLSLPLAKRLVELMGGRIEISSMRNKGTVVRIILNAVSQEAMDFHNISVDEQYISNDILKESGLKILIVEDDDFNALVMVEILSNIGDTSLAQDGDEAINLVKKQAEIDEKFDIMLMDINLPGDIDGIELMNQIKKQYKVYEKVPFIAQTAYAMSKDRERLLKSGFDDYISKPIDSDELLLIVKSKLV
jgi:signal transduction histidine kinase/ActR/RegA family two-component response regulator